VLQTREKDEEEEKEEERVHLQVLFSGISQDKCFEKHHSQKYY
jgi:hypothetical protein